MSPGSERAGRPVWAGRLPGGLAPEAWSFLHSLPHDRFLWSDDIVATMAHVLGLEAAGILSAAKTRRLLAALKRLGPRADRILDTDEDVHSAIERCLTEDLGSLGASVHAGRSRNDQVATAMRLHTRRLVVELGGSVLLLIRALVGKAAETGAVPAPGYTHLQRAQPVTVGHWLLSHAWPLERDLVRLAHAYRTSDVCPLGAGALAGSTLAVDPRVAARVLGFSAVFGNSMDAVSDRDFLLDACYAATVAATHVSRLAEDIVIWSSEEFGFLRISDDHATGSSMMPQKRNPDVAELARAAPGPAAGALVGLLMTLKGLPSAYDRDLQSDKQVVAGTVEHVTRACTAMASLTCGLTFDHDRLHEAVSDPALMATDLAEMLVRRGVPFRRAHERVAGFARTAAEAGAEFPAVAARPGASSPLSVWEALDVLHPKSPLARRRTPGGPAPASVKAQVRSLSSKLSRHEAGLAKMKASLPDPGTVKVARKQPGPKAAKAARRPPRATRQT
ncbi:MAG TPA: argininosuccinate lyase [Actinomycetota bacterium]|nr:argininosuccinate lyase [Actinomycetota bacterium]